MYQDPTGGRRSKIATEFTIKLENQPGQLASLSKSLGEAGVNIRALSGMVCEGKGIIKLLTSDEDATRAKLEELGHPFVEQEILTVTMPDRPGQLGDFAEMLGEADINIETVFVIDTAAGFTELAIGVDKIEEAKTLPLGQF
ncbi:MAG: ACT domain-containing protein [Anaerolineae bacterium]|nr:MAG: ACT domain-containing protein [Anaerolineae bacterium]